MKIHHNRVLFLVLGMIGGYLILHPYTMLVYTLVHIPDNQLFQLNLNEIRSQTLTAFRPVMLPMGISFVIFGGLIGFLIGTVIDRKRKLLFTEYENEKKKIAINTMKELMVTLSHYLLNANMIIGGKVRHSRKVVTSSDILLDLDVIEEQGRKIDAVVRALRKATEVKTADYTSSGKVKMIDIEREIEEYLKES